MRNLPAVALLVVVALTGCGGNGGETAPGVGSSTPSAAPDSPSTSADSTAPSTEPTHDVAADQAIVDGSILTLKDMPPGWTAEAPDSDEDDEGKAEIAKCAGVEYDDMYRDANAEAESDEFTSPEDEEVSVEVGLAATEEWMINAFEIASSSKFRECVVTSLEDEFKSDDDVEVGEIAINEMSFTPIGDDLSAFRMSLPLTSQGLEFEGIGDFVVVRVGRGQVLLSTFSLGNPMPVEELARFARLSVDRLTKGLAAES